MRLTILGCAMFAVLAGCEQNTFLSSSGVSSGGGSGESLVFLVQPATTQVNLAMPAIEVAAENAGVIDTTFTGAVSIGIGTNPAAGALTGTAIVDATAGVATFNTVGINVVGNGYTLVATATNEGSATSTSFNITAP
jgi:hypothetical protein